MRDHVKQIAYRNHIIHSQMFAMVHQQLHHHLQGCTPTLQHAGDGDQCLHQRRAEGVNTTEHATVTFLRQQDGHDSVLHPCHPVKRCVQLRPGRFTAAPQHSFFRNCRQIAIFEGDGIKTALLPVEGIAEAESFGAGNVVSHQFSQVALSSHEADQGNRASCGLRFHKVRQLGGFPLDETQIGGIHRQPEDQFVQKQDQSIVTQTGRVLADDRQSGIESDEIATAVTDHIGMGRRDGFQQRTHQLFVGFAVRSCCGCRIK